MPKIIKLSEETPYGQYVIICTEADLNAIHTACGRIRGEHHGPRGVFSGLFENDKRAKAVPFILRTLPEVGALSSNQARKKINVH